MAIEEDRSCCYLLVETRSTAEVAALLCGRTSALRHSYHQAAEPSASWPSIGPGSPGWTLLIDPHFEFGDADPEIQQWSAGTRIARLQIIERQRFSHATAWADGTREWDVSFDADLDERPLVDARFPYSEDRLFGATKPTPDVDAWYQVPIMAVRLLTAWHPRDTHRDPNELLFTELRYSRPAGVALAVARDRNTALPKQG